jgi:hypothetical protein
MSLVRLRVRHGREVEARPAALARLVLARPERRVRARDDDPASGAVRWRGKMVLMRPAGCSKWCMVAVLVSVSAACIARGGNDEAPAATLPVVERFTVGPGSAMRDGLVVPDGARLVGRTLDTGDGGWLAFLSVDENPLAAYDDVTHQARARGFSRPSSDLPCQAGAPRAGESHWWPVTEVPQGVTTTVLSCMTRLVGRASGGRYASLIVALERGHFGRGWRSHLVLERNPVALSDPTTGAIERPEVGDGPAVAVRAGLRLPSPGAPVPGAPADGALLVVAPGSEPLALPGPLPNEDSGGWVALFRLTAEEPAAVVENYLRQLATANRTDEDTALQSERRGRGTVIYGSGRVAADGPSWRVEGHLPDDDTQPRLLMIRYAGG